MFLNQFPGTFSHRMLLFLTMKNFTPLLIKMLSNVHCFRNSKMCEQLHLHSEVAFSEFKQHWSAINNVQNCVSNFFHTYLALINMANLSVSSICHPRRSLLYTFCAYWISKSCCFCCKCHLCRVRVMIFWAGEGQTLSLPYNVP